MHVPNYVESVFHLYARSFVFDKIFHCSYFITTTRLEATRVVNNQIRPAWVDDWEVDLMISSIALGNFCL